VENYVLENNVENVMKPIKIENYLNALGEKNARYS
jgi:hypothetical protein